MSGKAQEAEAAEAGFFEDFALVDDEDEVDDFFLSCVAEAGLAAGAAFSAFAAGAAAAGAEAACAKAPRENVAAIRAAMMFFMKSPW